MKCASCKTTDPSMFLDDGKGEFTFRGWIKWCWIDEVLNRPKDGPAISPVSAATTRRDMQWNILLGNGKVVTLSPHDVHR